MEFVWNLYLHEKDTCVYIYIYEFIGQTASASKPSLTPSEQTPVSSEHQKQCDSVTPHHLSSVRVFVHTRTSFRSRNKTPPPNPIEEKGGQEIIIP